MESAQVSNVITAKIVIIFLRTRDAQRQKGNENYGKNMSEKSRPIVN